MNPEQLIFKEPLQVPDTVIEKWIRHAVNGFATRHRLQPADIDDLEQDIWADLLRKRHLYDPRRGEVATFVKQVINSATKSMLRARHAEKRDTRREAVSLDAPIRDVDGREVDRAQSLSGAAGRRHTGQAPPLEDETDLRLDVADAVDSAPADLRRVAALLKQECRHAASRRAGTTRRQFASDVSRLRELFEDRGLRAYINPRTNLRRAA